MKSLWQWGRNPLPVVASVWTDCLADVPPIDPIVGVDLVDVVDLLAPWYPSVASRNHRMSGNRLDRPHVLVLLDDDEEVTSLHRVVL